MIGNHIGTNGAEGAATSREDGGKGAEVSGKHKSDCALHNGPAREPEPCDCGALPGLQPGDYERVEWPARTKR